MKRATLRFFFCAVLLLVNLLEAQVTLNPSPTRVLGHPQLTLKTANPNLVEGRELFAPQGAAVDTSGSPPILYVADTLNNRVLAWRNASQFANGAFADVVIGQRDMFTTFALGPGTSLAGGLNSPTGLAVDKNGNLFVADSGNNRILRFPKPLSQPDPVKLPDLVIGQTTLTSNAPNAGGRSASTLRLALVVSGRLVPTSLVFDPQGNLYCSDPGNGRVLRYPASAVGPGATNGPDADLILGQVDFTSAPQNPSSATDLSRLLVPAGIALDPSGRLYVTDARHRVLVYDGPPFSNGEPAGRLIGGLTGAGNQPLQPPNEASLNTPEGVFLVGNIPFVVDTANNRILRYDPFENWPLADVPLAKGVIGQDNVGSSDPNKGSAQASADSLFQPVRAVFAAGELFVVDSLNHRLVVFPDPTSGAPMSAGRVLGQGSIDTHVANFIEGREFFFGPGTGLTVDLNSDPPHLYVADTLNNRVLGFRDVRTARPGQKADLVIGQPELLRAIANYPSGDQLQPTANNLLQPTGVAVDADGNLYVADTGNGRVLRFPSPFQTGQNQPDADLVLGKPDFVTPGQAAPDPSPSNMGSPYGVAFTVEGHLLVSDVTHNRALFFLKPAGGDFTNGQAAAKVFGQPDFFSSSAGSIDNRMNGPRHIGTDTDDRLYVCDTGNNRVQIFGRVPAAGTDPSPVLTLTGLSRPQGIFVSAVTGEAWVASTQNGRVFRYPKFDDLIFNPQANLSLISGSERPLDVTLDSFGNLLVAYSTNRVALFFPAMTPVNAANFLPRTAPGMIVSLFPLDQRSRRFGEETQSAVGFPLPIELADVQVLVNDQPARLFFISPDQINFLMPMNAPTSGSIELQVVRRSVSQVLAVGCSAVRVGTNPDGSGRFACTGPVRMDVASPALFAGPEFATGTGQVAALNEDFTVNSPSNPISRGQVIQLFGTGQGFIPGAPPDGEAVSGLFETPNKPRVFIGTREVDQADVQFSGLAPNFAGLWQVNFKIPDFVAPANAVLVVLLHEGIASNGQTQAEKARILTIIAVKE